jgi:hypothetical protein
MEPEMLETSVSWSREERYYIAERAYRFYREGFLQESELLFAGLLAIDPNDAYCRQALTVIQAALLEKQNAPQLLAKLDR